jgi:hypothetical protein
MCGRRADSNSVNDSALLLLGTVAFLPCPSRLLRVANSFPRLGAHLPAATASLLLPSRGKASRTPRSRGHESASWSPQLGKDREDLSCFFRQFQQPLFRTDDGVASKFVTQSSCQYLSILSDKYRQGRITHRAHERMTPLQIQLLGGPMRQRVVRRIAAVLLLILTAGVVLTGQSAETTVYATRTGAKYHRAGCSSLRSSSIPMPLSLAVAKYRACNNCRPPVPRAASPVNATAAANPTPKAAPAQRAVQGGRCQAATKKGPQCSRKAKAGSSYCWQHGD